MASTRPWSCISEVRRDGCGGKHSCFDIVWLYLRVCCVVFKTLLVMIMQLC